MMVALTNAPALADQQPAAVHGKTKRKKQFLILEKVIIFARPACLTSTVILDNGTVTSEGVKSVVIYRSELDEDPSRCCDHFKHLEGMNLREIRPGTCTPL